jgi:hypothetical protein
MYSVIHKTCVGQCCTCTCIQILVDENCDRGLKYQTRRDRKNAKKAAIQETHSLVLESWKAWDSVGLIFILPWDILRA